MLPCPIRRRNLKYLLLSSIFLCILLYIFFGSRKPYPKSSKISLQRERTVFREDGSLGNYEPDESIMASYSQAGKMGEPYKLAANKYNKGSESVSEYGINMVASDDIGMDRSIPDTRDPECKHWDYPQNLPSTSVVIVFHNEGFSTLMRTVHTVIDRSPPQFLKEVLLVDDFSDKSNLMGHLDDYIKRFGDKVRLIRNRERQGLIRTRTRGAEEAAGDVVLFLDAHCEVNRNWLPPLLAPIYRDRTIMTVPIVDGIDYNSFEYRPVYSPGSNFRGIFEWGMLYKETELPEEMKMVRKRNSAPYKSPTHAGGLFAIDRKRFLQLGAYDPGLLVWGGENFELSFKIWQCNGSIEWVPCSRVGHVYRGFMPYNFGRLAEKKKGPLITTNYKRVIEVWFDEKHKKYFYAREPLAKFLDTGDISQQLELKKRLQCKNFQWFMDNVAFDLTRSFPELPENLHVGELKNSASQLCLDTLGHSAPSVMGVAYCHGFGNNQLIRLNKEGQLGVGERCIVADRQGMKQVFCQLGTVDGPWQYDESSKLLMDKRSGKCAAVNPANSKLTMLVCDPANNYHRWSFKEIVPNW